MSEETTESLIQVELGERSYGIHVAPGVLAHTAEHLARTFPKLSHLVCIFDEHVERHAQPVIQSCQQHARCTPIKIPSGEKSKSVGHMESVWNQMLEAKTDRGSVVVAIGGGVVGDLAGFAAASFARGIPFVQIPTTLLSQVDSSVGGKTGINLPGAKNIVGAFWQPSLVLIDPDTLQTLPSREYLSGVAEVVKYGVILLPEFFAYLENHVEAIKNLAPETLVHIIDQSCRAKARVVQEDERETSGQRAILNYGHTFGHALESLSEYGALLHGEAVSIGMHMAAVLAQKLGRADATFVERQFQLLHALGLPTQYDAFPAQQLWQRMQHDKKVEHGKLRFILPACMGQVELVPDLEESQVCRAIDAANAFQLQ